MTQANLPRRQTRSFGIRFSEDTFTRLDRVAKTLDSTPSDVIRECVRIALPELEARGLLEPDTYDRVMEVGRWLDKTPAQLVEAWTKIALPEAETKARRKARAEARKDAS